jgi:SPASM domain peptide maturase of grasp-with-spasm system
MKKKPLNSKYIYLYSDCLVTKGAKQCLFIDTLKKESFTFPVSYYVFFELFKTHKLPDIEKTLITKKEKIYFNEFVIFLLDNNYAVYVEDVNCFTSLIVNKREIPRVVEDVIIDTKVGTNPIFYKKVIHELDALNCCNIQLRFYEEVSLIWIEDFIKLTKSKNFKAIEIFFKFSEKQSEDTLMKFLEKHPIVSNLYVYNAPYSKTIANKILHEIFDAGSLFYIKSNLISCLSCGIINKKSLAIKSANLLTDNMNFNSCLNRKISINIEGDIKNCPSMKESFGNIKNTSLTDVLLKPDFKKYWNIKKDDIAICKDCEFRYICTDCRAYIEDPSDIYSKPLKCGYNPYEAKWEEWSTNPLKKMAINYYGMQDLISK